MTPDEVLDRVFGPDDHDPLPCIHRRCPTVVGGVTFRLFPCAVPEAHRPTIDLEELVHA